MKSGKLDPFQRFGECICNHIVCWTVLDLALRFGYSLSDEMELDINILRSCMEGGVFGEYNGTLVVTEECGWLGEWMDQFSV